MKNHTYIPGVDEPLPPGEELLWSGRPTVRGQLRHGLFLRVAGAWLLVAATLALAVPGAMEGSPLAHLAWTGVVALVVLGIAAGFALLVNRTTVYAVTDRRVVMRIGIALPSVLNLPLEELAGAAARTHRDGSGDIYLPLANESEVGWALLWPHVRPLRLARAEPALRWVDDVEEVAGILTSAALEVGRFEPSEVPTPRRRRGPARNGLEGRVAQA